MLRERRVQVRYVVDGLNLFVDGQAADILDVSASAVRVWQPAGAAPPAPSPKLHFLAESGFPAVDFMSTGTLVRNADDGVVYRYAPPAADWAERLRAFDTFLDLQLLALET